MFKRILIPTDGSEVARKARGNGISFAKELGATVIGYYAAEAVDLAFNPELESVRPMVTEEFKKRIAEQG